MSFYHLATQMEEAFQKSNEATTMASISYLPAQVGVVRSALQGLGRKKGRWNLEILEGDSETIVRFEDALEIKVPTQYWDSFQRIFDGALSNTSYLELSSVGLLDSVDESEEDLLETRLAEIHELVEKQLNNPALQKANSIATQWLSKFDSTSVTADSLGLIPLPILEGWKDSFVDYLTEGCREDLGQLEVLLEKLRDFRQIQEREYLAGGRIVGQYKGIDLIFEVHTGWDNVNTFSVAIGDDEVADAIEESSLEVPRIDNTFFPRGGQMDSRLGPENFINIIKEVIHEVSISGDGNHEENS